jgi:CheY-like chemotaxis protein
MSDNNSPAILIVEDDLDQRTLLIDFAMSQIKRVLEKQTLTDQQRQTLKNVQVISVTNIASLQKVVTKHKNVLLAVLDCNLPDSKGGPSHDQFIKTKHRITGQHKAVDVVTEYLPDIPITMISSQNRFQRIINLFYKNKHGIEISFISKKDPSTIARNIRYYLIRHIKKKRR